MEIHRIVERVQNLSDLELAALLCLIAKQHCAIEVQDDLVDDLAEELALVCGPHLGTIFSANQAQIVSEVFGLSYAVLSDEEQSSIDVFGDAILDSDLGSLDSQEESMNGEDAHVSCVPPLRAGAAGSLHFISVSHQLIKM